MISNIIGTIAERTSWHHLLMLIAGIIVFFIGLKIAKKILWIIAILLGILTIILIII